MPRGYQGSRRTSCSSLGLKNTQFMAARAVYSTCHRQRSHVNRSRHAFPFPPDSACLCKIVIVYVPRTYVAFFSEVLVGVQLRRNHCRWLSLDGASPRVRPRASAWVRRADGWSGPPPGHPDGRHVPRRHAPLPPGARVCYPGCFSRRCSRRRRQRRQRKRQG